MLGRKLRKISKTNKASETGIEVEWEDTTITKVRVDIKPDYVGSLDQLQTPSERMKIHYMVSGREEV